MNEFCRNELYWGNAFQEHLKQVRVCVCGLGGVGGFALEALARVGISNFLIIDFDIVSKTNINRQLIALNSTVGVKKTELWEDRLLDVNPQIKVEVVNDFIDYDMHQKILNYKPDYLIDAIDTARSKVELISCMCESKIKCVTSFGAGNRIDATKLVVADIKDVVPNCNFSKNILKNLKNAGLEEGLTVVYSTEKAKNIEKVKNVEKIMKSNGQILQLEKFSPASISTVPAVAGYLMANSVILDLYKNFNL